MLASTQGRGGGESEASGASIGGEYKKGWLGQERRSSAIVSVFFVRVGLRVGELCRIELVGLGGELPG